MGEDFTGAKKPVGIARPEIFARKSSDFWARGFTTDFTPDRYELYEPSIFEGANLGHPDLIDIQIQVPSVQESRIPKMHAWLVDVEPTKKNERNLQGPKADVPCCPLDPWKGVWDSADSLRPESDPFSQQIPLATLTHTVCFLLV